MTEMPWDAPVEDAAEQRAAVTRDLDDEAPEPSAPATRVPWDVDPADAAAEDAEVLLDDEEWR
ncbi:MAG: hypothetical protein HYR62_00235 [Actinobacteria bacterium]|nr:hypothetical protein [Actinomycetota bacterium]MBI3687790.1 hypothetical protein [Actinomycetota bacterium]